METPIDLRGDAFDHTTIDLTKEAPRTVDLTQEDDAAPPVPAVDLTQEEEPTLSRAERAFVDDEDASLALVRRLENEDRDADFARALQEREHDGAPPKRAPSVTSFFQPAAKKPKTALELADPTADPAARAAANKKEAKRKRALAFLAPLTDEAWRGALERQASKPYLYDLAEFVARERKRHTVYPPHEQQFAALDACALAAVKVVVVGQDPYHGPGQAHGLAFSIARGAECKFPPSLRNILNEAEADVGATRPPPGDGDLTAWAQRGVLLLNACLTVRRGEANSHAKAGWAAFTDACIDAVNKRPGKGAVFLLWGKPAQEKGARINKSKHRVLTSSHPSPQSNTTTATPFTGSKCFSTANRLLVNELGWEEGVEWNL